MMGNDDFCVLLDAAQARIEERMSTFHDSEVDTLGKHKRSELVFVRNDRRLCQNI